MADSFLDEAATLRAKAWAQVKETREYAAYKAFDDAVVALGGDTTILSGSLRVRVHVPGANGVETSEVQLPPRRISQTDAAASGLREGGMPLPVGRMMEAAIAKGAEVGGVNPMANFRSALSKDNRFYSFKRNGLYFWWFTGEPLPLKFQAEHKETADPDLLAESAVSGPKSQEGGDNHAATITT